MNHEGFRTRLDGYVDGLLGEPERLEMEGHARECRGCAGELAALLALVDAARRLPRVLEPGRDLWPELEPRLRSPIPDSGAPVSSRSAVGRGSPRWAGRGATAAPAGERTPDPQPAGIVEALRAAWRRPWALAGGLALLALVLWFAWAPERREPAGRHQPSVERLLPARPASAAEDRVFAAALTGLDLECMGVGKLLQAALRASEDPAAANVASSLAAGLSEVERSIAETRAALAGDPGNPALMRMLAARYQKKLAILHDALQRVGEA